MVTRETFTPTVENAFAGMGFPFEAPILIEFPFEMFTPSSDLTPINEGIDKIIAGLITWKPKTTTKGIITPPMIAVKGENYQKAVDNVNSLFLQRLLADGLPLVPPTADRVSWIMQGTDLKPNEVVCRMMPKGGLLTVQDVAAGLVMAGGRPEYLPVLLAALEAYSIPELRAEWSITTSGDMLPFIIVNGPIAAQIRLNGGYGCLGPHPLRPANGPIGRALRLLILGAGGAVPGMGSNTLYGREKFIGFVIAEDEEYLPKSPRWRPLSEQLGYPQGSNVVTMFITGSQGSGSAGIANTKKDADDWVKKYATTLKSNVSFRTEFFLGENGCCWCPSNSIYLRQGLAKQGYSKDDIMNYGWQNATQPWETITQTMSTTRINELIAQSNGQLESGKPWKLLSKPYTHFLVVCGGGQAASRANDIDRTWEQVLSNLRQLKYIYRHKQNGRLY